MAAMSRGVSAGAARCSFALKFLLGFKQRESINKGRAPEVVDRLRVCFRVAVFLQMQGPKQSDDGLDPSKMEDDGAELPNSRNVEVIPVATSTNKRAMTIDDDNSNSNNKVTTNADIEQTEQPRVVTNTTSTYYQNDNDSNNNKSIKRNVTPWFRQLRTLVIKNSILIQRKPTLLIIMLFSSVLSVVLAWLTTDEDVAARYELTEQDITACGTVSSNYIQAFNTSDYDEYDEMRSVPVSYNEDWRNGVTVSIMGLGPMMFATCVFLHIGFEFQSKLVGVLRGLGVRESVYWTSWWIPFLPLAFINALFGAITCAILQNSVHVFANTYFPGILASFLFLNTSLTGASMFLAAVGSTARRVAPWLIIFIFVAAWTPANVIVSTGGGYSLSASDQIHGYGDYSNGNGMFWVNKNTSRLGDWTWVNGDYIQNTTCDQPILSDEQGHNHRSDAERYIPIPTDEYFLGCYVGAGFSSMVYQQPETFSGLWSLWFFPQTHFAAVWSNFLGYTSAHNRAFGFAQASMSPEELAIDALAVPPSTDNAKDSSLYPQGSTLFEQRIYDSLARRSDYGWYTTWGNCPQSNTSEHFCSYLPYTCKSTPPPAPSEDSPSANTIFGYMVLLSFLYTLVAAYWAQVLPAGNGARLKPWFFLLPSYWCGGGSSGADESNQANAMDRIIVQEAKKKFGKCEAVKGISLEMLAGEVTALLGHNGAGKSTLSNMIACETTPTEGDILVFGHSVSKNTTAVRNLVGYCKQDDFLYPILSAKEHLTMYAGLGRVPMAEIPQKVQQWLESVDLSVVQDQFSKSYSGGMKRRLSVACCTISEKPLVILDEPTTGMDPVSRRFVWKHIDEIKDGRVILLTTHAMEEADLLADMVAIMRKGDLAGFGTPLELKSDYGSALQFSILVDSDSVAETESAISQRFVNEKKFVAVDVGSAGNITVNIASIRTKDSDDGMSADILSDFVAWLESDESKVTEYGFSNSSLEEVFLRLTEGDVEDDGDDGDDDAAQYDVCCAGCCPSCTRCCLAGPCRCCCCPTPKMSDADYLAGVEEEEIEQMDDEIASFKPNLTVRRQIVALLHFAFTRNWSGRRSIGNWSFQLAKLAALVLLGLYAANRVVYGLVPFMVVPTLVLSLDLVNFSSQIYGDRSLNQFYLMKAQGLLKNPYVFVMGFYPFVVMLAVALVAFCVWYATPMFRDTFICPRECDRSDYYCQETCYDWDWVPGDPPKGGDTIIPFWDDTFNGESVQLYAVNNAGSFSQVIGAGVVFALTVPGSVMASAGIPGHKFAIVVLSFVVTVASVAGAILYGVEVSRQGRSEEELDMCYWSVCNTTLGNFTVETIGELAPEFINCMKTEVGDFTHYCIPTSASILPQIGLFQALSFAFTSHLKLISYPPEYVEQKLVPLLGDSVECSGDVCQIPVAASLYAQHLGFMVLGAVLLLILGYLQVSIVFFPQGFVLSAKNWFVRVWSLLKCRCQKSTLTREQRLDNGAAAAEPLAEVLQEQEEVESIMKPFLQSQHHSTDVEEDAEQPISHLAIDHSKLPREEVPPVLTHKLRKVYPGLGGLPPKVALASLDLHVPKGQVLGLLGKNGAGKSTALKILAMAHEATAGTGLVAGYDVSTEQVKVFERLGTCPQFDIVWQRLSVKNHLEFFASLKGLPKNKVRHIALLLAKAVGLGAPDVYNRHAGGLSGGMRRRLSIAISLIGAPYALLLDEPSTGLDPSTRNSIWGLVSSFATAERAIVITTHNMEEADTLSNRIAIVSRGHLKVIGTQQHLKDNFGSGYRLQLNLTKSTLENQERAMHFVRTKLHKDAELQTKQAKTLHVSLPKELDLHRVFSSLYSNEASSEGCINQFLLSQSSLEDVFLALGD